MSDIDEMVAWLKAQLDDDEAYARNAFGDHNQAEPEWTEIWSGAVQVGPNEDLILTSDSPISRHMVRHDPARVLREVEAKRRIVNSFAAADPPAWQRRGTEAYAIVRMVLRLLALPYADRPGYRREWATP